MHPTPSDVVAEDPLPLVLPGRALVVGIGNLEPGAGEEQVQMERIAVLRLVIDAVEDRLVVTHVVKCGKLGRIEIAAGTYGVGCDEVAPLLPAHSIRKAFADGAE